MSSNNEQGQSKTEPEQTLDKKTQESSENQPNAQTQENKEESQVQDQSNDQTDGKEKPQPTAEELEGDNKYLMQENMKLRIDAEDMIKMSIKLQDENDKAKSERDKLLKDSMTLIEYNDYLQASKDTLETDLGDIKDKFYSVLKGLQETNDDLNKLEEPQENTDKGDEVDKQA